MKSILLSFVFISTFAKAESLGTRYLQRIDKPDEMVTLDFNSKVTILVFWKADCADCRNAIREAEAAKKEFGAYKVDAYAVYADYWGFYADRAKLQISTNLIQVHDAGFLLTKKLGGLRPPAMVAVAKNGEVIGSAMGESERQGLLKQIKSLAGR